MKTKKNMDFWRERKIDWEQSYFNVDHPHRELILEALGTFRFGSVLEIGCGAGANLYRIQQKWPHVQLGGVDINPDAIATARRLVPSIHYLEAGPAHTIFFGDKSTDIVLSDACLIYYGPFMVRNILRRVREIARLGVVFCELHSESMWERLTSRYHLHNYPKLLEKLGYYDVTLRKVDNWPGLPWRKFGYIIRARV